MHKGRNFDAAGCGHRAPLRPPPRLDAHSALFLDVDGTLLEIADRPDGVHVPSGLAALLGHLAAQRKGALALVSGRPIVELDRLFGPWHGAVAGLHGGERRHLDGTVERRRDESAALALDRLRPRLAALTGEDAGLVVEDKGATVALHYRAAPGRANAVRSIANALAREEPALRLIDGNMVVEFQPLGIDKGTAIAAFLGEPPFVGRRPIFVGDDATDEDGFAEIRRRGGLAVRVGAPVPSCAIYGLRDVAAVRRWLAGGRLHARANRLREP